MSLSINIDGLSDKSNPEFAKHLKVVEFCIANEVSYPKETSEFFKGQVHGEDIDDIVPSQEVIDVIKDGLVVEIHDAMATEAGRFYIQVDKLPKSVSVIRVSLDC